MIPMLCEGNGINDMYGALENVAGNSANRNFTNIYLYFAISYCLIKIYPFDGLEAKTNKERLGHAAHI